LRDKEDEKTSGRVNEYVGEAMDGGGGVAEVVGRGEV